MRSPYREFVPFSQSVVRDVSCVTCRACDVARDRSIGVWIPGVPLANRHFVGKEILPKFLLLLLLLLHLALVAKPSMRRSDNYVSLLKLFLISARRVPRGPEVPNRHRFHTHVQTFNFLKGSHTFFKNSWDSASFSNTCVKYQLSMYQEIPKSGSGAPGPESTPRGTKSITFAEGFCQPFNLPKFCWNTFWNTSWNTSCNTICYTVFYNVISCYTERFPQLPPAGSPEHWKFVIQ